MPAMLRLSLFSLLLLALLGCDTRDLAGPTDPGDNLDAPDALEQVTFHVGYELQATYAACDLTFRDDGGNLRTLTNVVSPWSTDFVVTVERSAGPYEAYLSATCADFSKEGKSHVMVIVDGDVVQQARATGYGATAQTHHFLWVE